jgi:SAM-dependent methyltransferase
MTDADAGVLPTADDPFWLIQDGLPRQGPGSTDSTRRLLAIAGPPDAGSRVVDMGCGPGRSALALAQETNAVVTGIDLHQPFLDELTAAARADGVADRVTAVNASIAAVPFDPGTISLIWSEGAAYIIGFQHALQTWRPLLMPGGRLVATECTWMTDQPSAVAAEFFGAGYPTMGTIGQNLVRVADASYDLIGLYVLPESDWWLEYYDPIEARLGRLRAEAAQHPGLIEAIGMTEAEIALRREHGRDYAYVGYVLEPHGKSVR